MATAAAPIIVDRYAIYARIAAGGMATVHLGRLLGEGGFSRTVAIKRLHAQYALDPEFVVLFLDEARLAARVRHPNVVPTLDVVAKEDEVFLVMDYVEGEPLSALLRIANERGQRIPPGYASSLMTGVLEGLHAAHEAKDDQGRPLDIVHRDMSPQNVLVGVDGVPRVIDFGVAKALGQVHSTREGQIRGKIAYMSPEQVRGGTVDARSDIFSASVVLWEVLTGRKLFKAENDVATMRLILSGEVERPSAIVPGLPEAVDALVLKGLAREPGARFATADEMAMALAEALPGAPARKVGAWVKETAGERLVLRAQVVRDIERSSSGVTPGPSEKPPLAETSRPDAVASSQPSGASQGSNVSVASPSLVPSADGARTRVLPIVLGAAVGLGLVIGVVLFAQSRLATSPARATVATAPSPPTTPDPSPPPVAAVAPSPAPAPSAASEPNPAPPANPASTPAPMELDVAPSAASPRPAPPVHAHRAPPVAASAPPPPAPPPASSVQIFSRF